MVTFSTNTFAAFVILIPVTPGVVPPPLMLSDLRLTVAFGALTIIPVVLLAKIEPCVPVQSSVIDFMIVTAPKPPGSRQLISPRVAVFDIAPANVLHGAVRLHGFTSSPTPEIHVRVACA
jgi:hypothetical protein